MDALNLLEERQSIRTYSSKPIPKEDLEKLLRAAIVAPTAINKQKMFYILLADQDKKNKLLKELNIEENYYGAYAILFSFSSEETPLDLLNDGAALQNVLLEATSLGIDCCWVHSSVPTLKAHKDVVAKELGIEGDFYIYDTVALGYSDKPRPAKRIKRGDGSKIL